MSIYPLIEERNKTLASTPTHPLLSRVLTHKPTNIAKYSTNIVQLYYLSIYNSPHPISLLIPFPFAFLPLQ
jgi:hypothetical protein